MFSSLTLLNESVDTQEVMRMKLKEVCLALCEIDRQLHQSLCSDSGKKCRICGSCLSKGGNLSIKDFEINGQKMFWKIASGGPFKRHRRFAGNSTGRRRIFIRRENKGL